MSTLVHFPFTAAILAGGKSLRMGRDKAELLVEGKSLLERQIALTQAVGANEILVSLRPNFTPAAPLPSHVRIVRDRFAETGPLGGIEACLEAAQNSWVLMLAVDLPSMSPEYLQTLLSMASTGQGVLAEYQNQFEPLASVYPKGSVAVARRQLDSGRFSLQKLAAGCVEEGLAVRWTVPPHLTHCLLNWNAPSDWAPPLDEGLPR